MLRQLGSTDEMINGTGRKPLPNSITINRAATYKRRKKMKTFEIVLTNLSNGAKWTVSYNHRTEKSAQQTLEQMYARCVRSGKEITERATPIYYCYRVSGVEFMVNVKEA